MQGVGKIDKVLNRRNLLTASIIIFILTVFFFYLPTLHRFWTEDGGNFTLFSGIVFVVFGILTVSGLFVIFRGGLAAVKKEQKGFTLFTIGVILLFFVPFLSSMGVLGAGSDFLGPVHIMILFLGIVLCLVGMVFYSRDGGYFSMWVFGTLFLAILGFHEAFKFVIYTGSYGMADRFLMYEGLGILLASFVLYIYSELKFIYLAYRIKEAQDLSDEGKLEAALEVLDRTIAFYPNYSTAWNNKGNALYRLKRYEEAYDCYDKVAFIDPEYPHTENNLKQVEKKLKKRRSTA